METFSAFLAICAGNSPGTAQRPVTRSFDVFFDPRLNQRLSKQPWGWWFETPSWSLWRQCNAHRLESSDTSQWGPSVMLTFSGDQLWNHWFDTHSSLQWRHNEQWASQITSLTNVYSTVYSGPDQTNHQSSASLAFVRGIHRGPVNSPHKWPVTRKMLSFDDVIMLRISRPVSHFDPHFQHLDACRYSLTFCLPNLTNVFTRSISPLLPPQSFRVCQPRQKFGPIWLPRNCEVNKPIGIPNSKICSNKPDTSYLNINDPLWVLYKPFLLMDHKSWPIRILPDDLLIYRAL